MKFKDFKNMLEKLRKLGSNHELYTSTQKSIGLTPEVSFEKMWETYIAQPAARAAVDFRADQIVGMGFFTTMNEEYREKIEGKTAKQYIDEFCEKIGLDQILQATAKNLVAFGNNFWWLKPKPEKIENITQIPIFHVQKITFSKNGELDKIKLSWNAQPREISMEEVIWIKTPPYDKNHFGTGILQTLCKSLKINDGESRPGFAEIVGRIQNSITKQFEKFGGPNELWIFPDLNKRELEDYYQKIKNIPAHGSRFVTNVEKAKVQLLVPERARSFDYYIETIMNEYYLGLLTPLPKLFTAPGFTEASAKVAVKVDDRKITALQRLLKRVIERKLFNAVLSQAGYDPERANVRLNWGAPARPEFNIADVLKAFENGVINREEARKILKNAGWPLEECSFADYESLDWED